jgi:hypothetical protein
MTDRIHVTMNIDLFVEDEKAMRDAAFERMRDAWSSEDDFPYDSAGDVPLGQVIHSQLEVESDTDDTDGTADSAAGTSPDQSQDTSDATDDDSASTTEDSGSDTDTSSDDSAEASDNTDKGDDRHDGDDTLGTGSSADGHEESRTESPADVEIDDTSGANEDEKKDS